MTCESPLPPSQAGPFLAAPCPPALQPCPCPVNTQLQIDTNFINILFYSGYGTTGRLPLWGRARFAAAAAGLFLAGAWLACGGFLAGAWLACGGFLAGAWLACGGSNWHLGTSVVQAMASLLVLQVTASKIASHFSNPVSANVRGSLTSRPLTVHIAFADRAAHAPLSGSVSALLNWHGAAPRCACDMSAVRRRQSLLNSIPASNTFPAASRPTERGEGHSATKPTKTGSKLSTRPLQ